MFENGDKVRCKPGFRGGSHQGEDGVKDMYYGGHGYVENSVYTVRCADRYDGYQVYFFEEDAGGGCYDRALEPYMESKNKGIGKATIRTFDFLGV